VITVVIIVPIPIKQEFDMCEIVSTGCPAEGNVEVKLKSEIPSFAPSVSQFCVQLLAAGDVQQ